MTISRDALTRRIAGAIKSGFDAHEWSPEYLSSIAKRVAGEIMPFICSCPVGVGTVHRVTEYVGERGSKRVNETWPTST